MVSSFAALSDCIGEDLRKVEDLFDEEVRSQLACVNTLARHVSRYRGKMLRPTLVLLTGKACGGTRPEHITVATVVEMVHMATLVHDDVLDDAEMRRKGATINHLRGNEAAVLLGDYLISHSYHLCSSIGSQEISRAVARTTNEVCEGELLQIDNRGNLDLNEETYFGIITRKTASLCSLCSMLGAKLAGADERTVDAMERYGRRLGEAFQIQDDILDLIGDVRAVGKTLGTDIEKGKLTLPMIHFMRTAPVQHRELLRSLLVGTESDKGEKIRNLILPSHSIDYARDRARTLVDEAITCLETLPESAAKAALLAAAQFVIDRPL